MSVVLLYELQSLRSRGKKGKALEKKAEKAEKRGRRVFFFFFFFLRRRLCFFDVDFSLSILLSLLKRRERRKGGGFLFLSFSLALRIIARLLLSAKARGKITAAQDGRKKVDSTNRKKTKKNFPMPNSGLSREVAVVVAHLVLFSQLGVLTRIGLDQLFSNGCKEPKRFGTCLTSLGAFFFFFFFPFFSTPLSLSLSVAQPPPPSSPPPSTHPLFVI